MREIEEEMLGRNKELLVSVARTLGGEVRLESRHRRVPLDDRAAVLVVMGDPPRMVVTVLIEAFGVAAGQLRGAPINPVFCRLRRARGGVVR